MYQDIYGQPYSPQPLDYGTGQQPQQQGGMGGMNPMQGLGIANQMGAFGGGGGGGIAGNAVGSGSTATGSAAGTGGGSGFGGAMASAGPWVLLAAAIGAKAEHTRKTSDISFKDQLSNVSLAPQKDFDHWGLDKYAPFGGGEVYKGTFDLATGDFSNWIKSFKYPIEDIFNVNL